MSRADSGTNDDMVMVLRPNGTIEYATTGAAALVGYPQKQLGGMQLRQLLQPPYAHMHQRYLRVSGCGLLNLATVLLCFDVWQR